MGSNMFGPYTLQPETFILGFASAGRAASSTESSTESSKALPMNQNLLISRPSCEVPARVAFSSIVYPLLATFRPSIRDILSHSQRLVTPAQKARQRRDVAVCGPSLP